MVSQATLDKIEKSRYFRELEAKAVQAAADARAGRRGPFPGSLKPPPEKRVKKPAAPKVPREPRAPKPPKGTTKRWPDISCKECGVKLYRRGQTPPEGAMRHASNGMCSTCLARNITYTPLAPCSECGRPRRQIGRASCRERVF